MNFEHSKDPVRGRTQFVLKDTSNYSVHVFLWGELSHKKVFKDDIVVLLGTRVS